MPTARQRRPRSYRSADARSSALEARSPANPTQSPPALSASSRTSRVRSDEVVAADDDVPEELSVDDPESSASCSRSDSRLCCSVSAASALSAQYSASSVDRSRTRDAVRTVASARDAPSPCAAWSRRAASVASSSAGIASAADNASTSEARTSGFAVAAGSAAAPPEAAAAASAPEPGRPGRRMRCTVRTARRGCADCASPEPPPPSLKASSRSSAFIGRPEAMSRCCAGGTPRASWIALWRSRTAAFGATYTEVRAPRFFTSSTRTSTVPSGGVCSSGGPRRHDDDASRGSSMSSVSPGDEEDVFLAP
mmetsp:Transcript_16371/g.66151  ORF Transcript_16371/g.66151 Transcript_16371/m.66151 type:complete len:310 (-) Transcript_16371:423-1352(-)